VRVSVVDDGENTFLPGAFTYESRFRYRWTDRFLHTSLLSTVAGAPHTFQVGGSVSNITVKLPKEGEGVKGFFFGDPCTEADFVGCIHANMTKRLPRLVNALSDLDYRVVLGDNWYDQAGGITRRFFEALTNKAQAQIQVTVPGNHDFWRAGARLLRTKKDQLGNGFMQFYAQDTLAGKGNPHTTPFDFSNDPDTDSADKYGVAGVLPTAENFLFYHTIGNAGFVGFSGAHTASSSKAAFEEACLFFLKSEPRPKIIYLNGHWNADGLGAEPEMDTMSVYKRLRVLPGCDTGALRFMMGHKHCNAVVKVAKLVDGEDGGAGRGDGAPPAPPEGYLLGGTGVRGSLECNTFGFAYVDTTGGRELVVGFELANATTDKYDAIVECIERSSIDDCLRHGTVWANASLARYDR
jgi:hypothetical protein